MTTVKTTRALALGVTAALAATAFSYAPASAAPSWELVATSQDGAAFDLDAYAAGDITVQVTDPTAGGVDVVDQDLEYSWSVTSFAPNAAPVPVPATGTTSEATEVNGKFVVPLPVAQGPGVYTLTAALDAGSAGTPVPSDEILTVRTGNAAPAGSAATITGLAGGTPGRAQAGTLTVTAPDDTYGTDAGSAPDPVVGQVYSLTVDHGFFTTGTESTPSVPGAQAGNLDQRGTRLTGVTDSEGEIDFQVGIARDGGFDDDGKVAATVKVATGFTAGKSAAWDSSDPLNGRVELTLSPAGEQDGPVNPALAGDRTFYEVSTFDQFGNRVGGETIELGYTGNLDDWDYSDDSAVSDFDSFGDIWITSFEAGAITITGTWEDAPTFTYVDTNGGTQVDTAPASSSITSSTYEARFTSARFSMTSSVTDTVRTGTSVTQTVRVVDQLGNPVRGYEVRFYRSGPDSKRSDAVATRTTNTRGEASYTFVGTKRGRAKITAEVTDGDKRRVLSRSVVFGYAIKARLAKGKGGSSADRLAVSARSVAAGARVRVYKIVKGKRYAVGSKRLNAKGKAAFTIRDRNRSASTTYVAIVRSTSKSVADQSNTVKLR
nr:hypothetical protein [Aeromicrobium sp.]